MKKESKIFIDALDKEFCSNANADIAIQQEAYMKNQFEFFGIKTPLRRKIQQPFLINKYLPPKDELEEIVKFLWKKPQREFHYFAQEFAFRYVKNLQINDIQWMEHLIVHQSWWDTVDFIAPKLIGNFFLKFPEKRDEYLTKWLTSNNIWLQRSCILFQLKYKDKMDLDTLTMVIESLQNSKEFFINKAIGWILRERSKSTPDWVMDFVENHELSNLSRKEALRLIL